MTRPLPVRSHMADRRAAGTPVLALLNGERPPRHGGRNGRSCKRQGRLEAGLALGVLLSLTGLLETGLLALDDAGVTTQVTGLLQGGAVVLGVDLVQ